MADQNNDPNRVIFGAEFDGEGVAEGVDQILNSLEKAREAEALLKQAIKETTEEMKKNRKEAEKLEKQMSTTIDTKLIDDQTKKLHRLNAEYDDLTSQQADLTVASKATTDQIKKFNKVNGESAKTHNDVSKAISKFTNINHLAADGVKKIGNYAKEAAFSFVSGFAGGILGSVVPALIDWISGMVEATDEMTKLQKQKEILNGVFTAAAKAVGDDAAKLEVYRIKLNDTNIPAADRVKIAKEYNKTADETNKIDLKQIDNLELINQRLEAQNKLILQRAISTAALAKLTEASTSFIDAQLKLDQALKVSGKTEADIIKRQGENVNQQLEFRDQQIKSLDNYQRKTVGTSQVVNKALNKEELELASLISTRNEAKKQVDELAALLSPLITPEGLTTKDGAVAQIENVFLQKLAELKARLAQSMASSFQSEPLIRKQFAAQLDKEYFEIGQLLKQKKLTIPQADLLKGLLKQINGVDLSKGLEEFRKKVADALKRVNDEIQQALLEEETKRVNNIRDEFEREQAVIANTFEQAVAQIKIRSEAFAKKIDEDTKAGFLSPEIAARKKLIAAFFFGGLTEQAEQAKLNAQMELAFKVFQKTLEDGKRSFESALLQDNEQTTKNIRFQVAQFLEGKITYERYQKNITAILKKESSERRKIQLDEAETSLELLNKQIAATTDPKQLQQLTAQRDALRAQISALKREIATGVADDKNAGEKKRIDDILAYVNAVQNLASSVVQFWQQVNAAEAASLDRSIALQNKRVENAREVAEKGNAEYLEMEQKRLDELERKRADNARKQLAINNALAASNAIVAAITAIAQAVQTGSPLAAIAAVAAVIGAIGAAYNFVNSLQPQEATFFEGTEFVDGRGVPPGKDKVRARLHVGERVVTAKDNEAYWNTLSAIHNHRVPADVLNSFVDGYPNGSIPVTDFDRLAAATGGQIGADSLETLARLDTLNDTMGQVVVGLSEIGINFNLDENGFEASLSQARKRRLVRKRS